MLYYQNTKVLFIYDGTNEILFSKKLNSDQVEEVCYCYKGHFPGKNIRKDDEENNLYVLTGNNDITVYLDYQRNQFKTQIKIVEESVKDIIDFRPLEQDKLVVLGSKCELSIFRFNKFSQVKIAEFMLSRAEENNRPIEAASLVICPRSVYVVVSAHDFFNGSKKRLYLLKIGPGFKFQLLTIKQYPNDEPDRNSYITMSMDFYLNNRPMLLCYENSSSGQVIAYLIENERFEIFQVFDRFMSHYCYFSTVYSNNIWSIDNSGKIRCLQIVKENDLLHDFTIDLEMRSTLKDEDTDYWVDDDADETDYNDSVIESDLRNQLSTPFSSQDEVTVSASSIKPYGVPRRDRSEGRIGEADFRKKAPNQISPNGNLDNPGRNLSKGQSNDTFSLEISDNTSNTDRPYSPYDDLKKTTKLEGRQYSNDKDLKETVGLSNEKPSGHRVSIVSPSNLEMRQRKYESSSYKLTPDASEEKSKDEGSFLYEEPPKNSISNIGKNDQSQISDYFLNEKSARSYLGQPSSKLGTHLDKKSHDPSFLGQSIFNEIDNKITSRFTYEQEKRKNGSRSPRFEDSGVKSGLNSLRKNNETISKDYLRGRNANADDQRDFYNIEDVVQNPITPIKNKNDLENDPHVNCSFPLRTPEAKSDRVMELRQPSLRGNKIKQERERVLEELERKKRHDGQVYPGEPEILEPMSETRQRILPRKTQDFRTIDERSHSLFVRKPPREVSIPSSSTFSHTNQMEDHFNRRNLNKTYDLPSIVDPKVHDKGSKEYQSRDFRFKNFDSFQNKNLFTPETRLKNCFRNPMIYKTKLSSGK